MWPVAIIFKIVCHFKKASVWIYMVMMREKMVNGGDDEEADEYADDVDGVDGVGSCYAAVQYWLCVAFARGCWSVMVFKSDGV